MNLKNSGDSTGFEQMTSALVLQCSNQLSYEVTQLRAGQFVGLMFSRESPEFFTFMGQLARHSIVSLEFELVRIIERYRKCSR